MSFKLADNYNYAFNSLSLLVCKIMFNFNNMIMYFIQVKLLLETILLFLQIAAFALHSSFFSAKLAVPLQFSVFIFFPFSNAIK